MQRVCFQLQVKPEQIEEYKARHREVWPEMLQALQAAGWNNYSLFLAKDGMLIGYFETESLEQAQKAMAATEVNGRWQAEMAQYFQDLDTPPDEGFIRLEEVFNLTDLLNKTNPIND